MSRRIRGALPILSFKRTATKWLSLKCAEEALPTRFPFQQAARGTDQINSNLAGVTQASGEVGTAAAHMPGSAKQLSEHSERLRREVASFLATVRAAACSRSVDRNCTSALLLAAVL